MLSDFFGVEPDGRLAVKTKVQLQGGGELLLRPLSLEKLFALMQIGLPNFSMEAIGETAPEEFMVTFAEKIGPAVTVAIDQDAAALDPLDLPSIVLWYIGEHDWKRIYAELLSPGDEPAPAPTEDTVNSIIDLMFAIEIATEGARPVERQLKMRPEAWLSTLGAMERRAQNQKPNAQHKPGEVVAKRLSMDQLFAMMPGGETVNVSAEPGEGGH